MALTRKLLKSMGIEDDKIEEIIEAHAETVTALKDERDAAKADADKTAEVIKERDSLKQQLEAFQQNGTDAAKVQAEFDAFKKQVETEKTNASKAAAVKKLLRDSGVQRDTFLNLLMGKVDLDQIEMDGDALKDADGFVKTMREGYSDCFGTVETSGAGSSNPPSGGMTSGTGQTKEEILAIKDTAKRQQAIADNHELFGF